MYQVHIADGIQFIGNIANSASTNEVSLVQGNGDASSKSEVPSSNGSHVPSHEKGKMATKVDIVIIDVDSADSR